MKDINQYMTQLGQKARKAAKAILAADTGLKNAALAAIAEALNSERKQILDANQKDLDAGKANHLDAALLDRLALNNDRIDAMIEGLHQVAALPDPCGEITDLCFRPSGVQVGKMRAPLGVVGIIYESRPNVTIDAASLCMKSGNAAILRGGKEAIHSNQAIAKCLAIGLEKVGLPADVVQVLEVTDREAVGKLITMNEYVDVVVPRGGKGLIERIANNATVTVIKHLDGICHVYIDKAADNAKAVAIAINSKTHRYGVCNAMETLLIHRDKVDAVLPEIARQLLEKGVEIRGSETVCQHVEQAIAATEEDWDTEYLAPVLSIRVVESFDEAVAHISRHSSQHTESIVTENYTLGRQFLSQIDSSSVMINTSTRFADGFEYGLGAEIGISTDKIHVRGPVGLEGLTSQKWIVLGDGHIRQ